MTNIKEIAVEDRLKMINEIERSSNYQSNVGQALILIIDKLEDLEKPKVIGKLFTAVLSKSLDYDTFLRISQGIEKIFYPDIKNLLVFSRSKTMQYNILQQLCNAGFLVPTRNDEALSFGKGNEFKFSHLGVILLKILYSETVHTDFFYTESESANIMSKEKSKSESDKNTDGFAKYDT